MIIYLIIRSQSTQPTKPNLHIDYLPFDATKLYIHANEPEYEYDEIKVHRQRTNPFILGAGIPKNKYSSCSIRKTGTVSNARMARKFAQVRTVGYQGRNVGEERGYELDVRGRKAE